MTVLDEILAAKRAEVALLQQSEARTSLRKAAIDAAPARDFTSALRRADGTLAVIGEIKRRSPSKGDLAPDLDAATAAKSYEDGGASALSVLTDHLFFAGSVDDLTAARDATALPTLRKDFTVDETQVYETRALGADAILLIVAALPDDGLLRALHELAREAGLACIVEAHDERELERALAVGARIVGVNARDLTSFAEDLGVTERLVARVPPDVVAVAESAIRGREDARRVADAGFDAALVGEALVRAADAAEMVRSMTGMPTSSR